MDSGKASSSSFRAAVSEAFHPSDSRGECADPDGPVVSFHFSHEAFELPSMGLAPLDDWQPAHGFGVRSRMRMMEELHDDHLVEMLDLLPLADVVQLARTCKAVVARLRATEYHAPENFRSRYAALVHLAREPWSPDAHDASQLRRARIDGIEGAFEQLGRTDFLALLTSLKPLVVLAEEDGLNNAGRRELLDIVERAESMLAPMERLFLYRSIAALDLSSNSGIRQIDDLIARIGGEPIALEPLLRNGFMRQTQARLEQVSRWLAEPDTANLQDVRKLWSEVQLPPKELQWFDSLRLVTLRRLREGILDAAQPTYELPPEPQKQSALQSVAQSIAQSVVANCVVS